MFAARTLAGLAAGNIGMVQAIIADRVKPSERVRYIGLFGTAIGTGFVADWSRAHGADVAGPHGAC